MANLQEFDPSQPSDVMAINKKLKMAEVLRQQSAQDLPGQMVSNHYVAPSITQHLSRLLNAYESGKLGKEADTQTKDYQAQKAAALAALLKGNQPTAAPIPEAEPLIASQQNSPLGGMQPIQQPPAMQPQAAPIQPMPQAQPNNQAAILEYMQKYGNSPEAQVLMAELNHQRDRGERKEDVLDQRTYEGTTHARDRGEHLLDVKDAQEFQRIQNKENQGFQLTMAEKQFKNQVALQSQSQNFQAGQNKLNRDATVSNQPLMAVVGADGQPKYVSRSDAVGAKPYSAKQEATDALKVQQKSQAEIGAQQVLDQALMLHQHPGRSLGTGASSFMSNIPGTDAKGFKANLDTFKAQTFVPMVSALKGMGALSDAEGKKLSDSVGALDPSMPEKEFDASLQRITKTLYDKARASGLNVSLPDFGGMGGTTNSGAVKKYNPATGRIE